MMRINKNNCTETTMGTIVERKEKGLDFPTMITVEYQVNDINYTVTESVKLKSEVIKLGFLPIGQKKTPKMGNTGVGSLAQVSYNPNNPSESFLTDNVGKMNV